LWVLRAKFLIFLKDTRLDFRALYLFCALRQKVSNFDKSFSQWIIKIAIF
jgi:hypothetical protein